MKNLKRKKYSILSSILKYSFVIVFAVMVISPYICIGEGTGTNITVKIDNPLGSGITDIPSFIEALINIVLIVGIPIVVLAIIYTGFLFVQAQGNPEEITKAKKAFLYTVIGAALLLGAFVIAKAIGATVDEIKSTT
jgi:hypothetical protein